MFGKAPEGPFEDHCRIGSLENQGIPDAEDENDHCRIGSLESKRQGYPAEFRDHCRIGSLERLLYW